MNLWNQPGVPHKGWTCLYVTDLVEPQHTCEMCGKTDIRYVHTMEHPVWPEPLDVGCVCDENMSGDYVGPRKREQELKNKASRAKRQRERELKRREQWAQLWRPLQHRGRDAERLEWRTLDRRMHLSLRVVQLGGGWRCIVAETYGRRPRPGCARRRRMVKGRRRYPSAESAKLAIFDWLAGRGWA